MWLQAVAANSIYGGVDHDNRLAFVRMHLQFISDIQSCRFVASWQVCLLSIRLFYLDPAIAPCTYLQAFANAQHMHTHEVKTQRFITCILLILFIFKHPLIIQPIVTIASISNSPRLHLDSQLLFSPAAFCITP
jgi:hypothetical protein